MPGCICSFLRWLDLYPYRRLCDHPPFHAFQCLAGVKFRAGIACMMQGHYTLSPRMDLDDPAYDALMDIASEMEERPENRPASALKRQLSTANLLSARLAQRFDAKAQVRTFGRKAAYNFGRSAHV